MSKLDRRRKGVFGPAMGKQCIIFIDDLNLPQRDSVGSIPAIELLRQVSILQLACASFISGNAKASIDNNLKINIMFAVD